MARNLQLGSNTPGSAIGQYLIGVLRLGLACLLGFAIFLVLAWLGLFSGIETVFYRGVLLAGVAALLLFAAMLVAGRLRPSVSAELTIAAVAMTFSLSVAFLIVGPVTVDRSITVFLLSHMDRHEQESFTPAQLEAEFEATYLGDWEQVARRMEEQSTTGYVREVSPGTYAITPTGQRAMHTFRWMARLFDTDPRFVGEPGKSRSGENP